MRGSWARAGLVGAAALGLSCSKFGALEPELETIAGCGDVVELVEVDGRVHGLTVLRDEQDGEALACAFDLDVEGSTLRHDRFDADPPRRFGGLLVGAAGAQTIAAHWDDGESLRVGLFRRDAEGLRQLDEGRVEGLTRSFGSHASLVPSARGPALAIGTRVPVGDDCGLTARLDPADQREAMKERLRLWQPEDSTLAPLSRALALRGSARLFHEAGVTVALEVEGSGTKERPMGASNSGRFVVRVLDTLDARDDVVRWTRDVVGPGGAGPDGAERGSRLQDIAIDGEHVFILASEGEAFDGEQVWLACLAVGDGQLLWTTPVELEEFGLFRAGMRPKDGGVVVALFGHRGDVHEFGLVAVSAAGQTKVLGRRKLRLPPRTWIDVLELDDDDRVWLGGARDDETVITSVALR